VDQYNNQGGSGNDPRQGSPYGYGPQGPQGPQGRQPYYGQAPQGPGYGGGPYTQPAPGYYYGEIQIPPEVRRWNWGAFALNWIWGCSNGAFLTLLCLIPYFNIVWIFICGARGNRWAWKSGKFKDLETFLAVQKTWNIAGVIIFVIFIASLALIILLPFVTLSFLLPDGILDQNTDFGDFDTFYS
jgi:hypothetical protein